MRRWLCTCAVHTLYRVLYVVQMVCCVHMQHMVYMLNASMCNFYTSGMHYMELCSSLLFHCTGTESVSQRGVLRYDMCNSKAGQPEWLQGRPERPA